MERNYTQIRIAVIVVGLLLLISPVFGQKPNPTAKPPDPGLMRWRIVLDGLVQEARTVSPEERRPYAITEVASAYWEIDHNESQELFIKALDEAWKLTEIDKKNRPVLNHVLVTASKLDVSLAKVLTDRLLKKEGGDKGVDDLSTETALDLLKTDPRKAAELAEAFAPNGLEDGTAAFFIFKLAEVDVSLANRVYSTFLNKAIAKQNISVRSILPLAGYAFGYTEYRTVSQNGVGTGGHFWRNDKLFANPAFIRPFLSLAYGRVSQAIEQRNNATGVSLESLNHAILFALAYLVPEVARFSPGSLAAWQQLEDRGIVGVSPEQSQRVAAHMDMINLNRAKLQSSVESAEKQMQWAEESLDEVEKIVGTCERDVIYSRAVFTFSYRKNFKRALEVAGKIEGQKQNDMVMQVVNFDLAEAAIKDGDWDGAQKQIKKLSSYGIKAIANAELARALLNKNEKSEGEKMVDAAAVLSEKLSEARERSGLLFGLASILLKSDPAGAIDLFARAVKSLNKQEPVDKWKFSIPVRIPLFCGSGDGPEKWADQSLPNSNILDATLLFAKENPDQTNSSLDAISDKVTRIRSQAIVAKIALAKLRLLLNK